MEEKEEMEEEEEIISKLSYKINEEISIISNTENDILNNSISTIKLSSCENKLRDHYNISNNISLYIFKKELFVEGYKIPKIQYEIFNSKTNEKLDLNICENMKVNIFIPVNIDENNLDKYNPKSSYYNDLCNTYKTEKGTDITLKDRRRIY